MIVVTVITYSNHFYNAFHFDDSHSVENNSTIRNVKNIPLFFADGTTSSVLPQNQSYRPVVTTSLSIDYWLGKGYDLFYFHLSSFMFFLLQGILMVLFFNKIFNLSLLKTNNIYIAIIAATWYLVHPAIAETVNYIIARSDLLSTFFVVLAFVLYSCSLFCKKTFLYLLPVGIGALAKPTAVMFAPILLFYIFLFETDLSLVDIFKKQNLKRTWHAIVKSIPSFVFCAAMYLLVDKMTPKTWEPGGTAPLNYLITQPFVILHYFGTLFLPVGLSADTDWKLINSVADVHFIIGAIFVLLMLVVIWHTSKNKEARPISFGLIWFFLALMPTSSIIPLAEVLNDHRMYFPFVGLVMSMCWMISLLIGQVSDRNIEIAITSILILLLPVYALGAYQRNKVWHTEENLWYDVTIKSPENGRGLMNYALTQMAKGNYAKANDYFNRALKLLPNYALLYTNMGVLKDSEGDSAAAERNYLQAISLGYKYPDTHYFYALFLKKQLRYNEAVAQLKISIQLSPNYAKPKILLDEIANDKQGPATQKYIDRSLAYYSAGKYQECISLCDSALLLKPGYGLAYNNICAAYNKLGKYPEAIQAGEKGLKFDPNNQLLKNNLAEAYRSLKNKKNN